ncbi:hypothetical protein M9H77_18194 [Catharanthus roseus]|uniref:Uncharacterized protein n=1 Tax=Catharanthus roseus TaxID=4058 RepID=A0ACC0B6R9_CATRO|nr:hypothetical protein M9H77_18194 [Catharanthus roseus]
MVNFAKLEFIARNVFGKNYLSWTLDAEIHLDPMGLLDSSKENNTTSNQDRAKDMIFLRHHLHKNLKATYLIVKNSLILCNHLKESYDYLKMVVLPKARYDWLYLRLQDFKSISEYNSSVFRITSQLKLCEENLTDANMLGKNILYISYFEYTPKYSDLISCLQVAKQNNELLMRNHETRPTAFTPFSEVNATSASSLGRSRGCGRGHNRGRKRKGKEIDPVDHEDTCYRCGMNRHWSCTCHTTKHLVDLYRSSLEKKEKSAEANFTSQQNNDDIDDVSIY